MLNSGRTHSGLIKVKVINLLILRTEVMVRLSLCNSFSGIHVINGTLTHRLKVISNFIYVYDSMPHT